MLKRCVKTDIKLCDCACVTAVVGLTGELNHILVAESSCLLHYCQVQIFILKLDSVEFLSKETSSALKIWDSQSKKTHFHRRHSRKHVGFNVIVL